MVLFNLIRDNISTAIKYGRTPTEIHLHPIMLSELSEELLKWAQVIDGAEKDSTKFVTSIVFEYGELTLHKDYSLQPGNIRLV